MALTKCSECGKDVSDKAAACPNCGNPIYAEAVTTIQRTSKKWKKYQAVAIVMWIVGFILIFKGGGYTATAILLWVTAIGVAVVGRIGAWWNHD